MLVLPDTFEQRAKLAYAAAFSPVCVHCPEVNAEDPSFGARERHFQKGASGERNLMPLIVANGNATYERYGLAFACCLDGHPSRIR